MPSLALTGEMKRDISRKVDELMRRRLIVQCPFPASAPMIVNMSFKNQEDLDLMRAFEKRFARGGHFNKVDHFSIHYEARLRDCALEWTVSFVQLGESVENGKAALNRERDPEHFDEILVWLELHKVPIVQWQLAKYLVDEVLRICATTSQLQWLWPSLLHLDRSGKREKLSETSRPRNVVEVNSLRRNWYKEIDKWTGMAALMPTLEVNTSVSIPLLGGRGKVYFDQRSLEASILNNLKGLQVDEDGHAVNPKK